MTSRTNAARTTTPKRVPMDTARKTALAVGVLFILTFAVNAAARIIIERRKAFTE